MSFLNSVLQGTSDAFRDLFADSAMLPLALLFMAVFIGILAVPRLVTSRSPVDRPDHAGGGCALAAARRKHFDMEPSARRIGKAGHSYQ